MPIGSYTMTLTKYARHRPRVFNLALFTHFSVPRPCDESEPLVAAQDVDLKSKDSIAVPDRNCVSGTGARPVRLNTLASGSYRFGLPDLLG